MQNMYFDALLVVLTAACSSDCSVAGDPPSPTGSDVAGWPAADRSAAGQSATGCSASDCSASGCSDQGSFIWWLGLQRFGSRQVVVLPQVGVICVVGWLTYRKLEATSLLRPPTLRLGHFIKCALIAQKVVQKHEKVVKKCNFLVTL